MTDKDFYDRIDKACSLFTSPEAVVRYCHDIRMLEDTLAIGSVIIKSEVTTHALSVSSVKVL